MGFFLKSISSRTLDDCGERATRTSRVLLLYHICTDIVKKSTRREWNTRMIPNATPYIFVRLGRLWGLTEWFLEWLCHLPKSRYLSLDYTRATLKPVRPRYWMPKSWVKSSHPLPVLSLYFGGSLNVSEQSPTSFRARRSCWWLRFVRSARQIRIEWCVPFDMPTRHTCLRILLSFLPR